MAEGTREASASVLRSTNQTPSGKASSRSAAACNARRVLPTPPGSRDGQQPDVIPAEEVDNAGNLILPPEKGGRLQGQVVRTRGECPDRGEVGRQVGMEQLEDPLGSIEVAQRMLAEVAQAGSWRERVPGEILRGQREEHLAAMARGQQAGEAVQPGSEIVPVLRGGGGGMQRHADPQRSDALGPRLLHQRSLRIERRGHRIRSGGERGLHRIADHFEERRRRGVSMAARKSVRWRATAAAIAAWSRSQSAVLPSMSVKRKVTVPEGRSSIDCLPTGLPRVEVI